jgi:hypothetical protein
METCGDTYLFGNKPVGQSLIHLIILIIHELKWKGVLGSELADMLQSGDGASDHRQFQGAQVSERCDQKWHLDWQLQLLDWRNPEGLQRKLDLVWKGWRNSVQRWRDLGQGPTGQQRGKGRLHPPQVEKELDWSASRLCTHR